MPDTSSSSHQLLQRSSLVRVWSRRPARADFVGMLRATVECLSCAHQRVLGPNDSVAGGGECPRCGYLGWAEPKSLTEPIRRLLREIPVPQRRLQTPHAA